MQTCDVPRGLAGVVVTDTALGDVRGREGFYHYRQYSAVELAQSTGFEDVWHLMFYGELPGRRPAAGPSSPRRRPCAGCPTRCGRHCPAIARASAPSGPLAGLRTALSLLGAASGLPAGLRPRHRVPPQGRAGRMRRRTDAAHRALPAGPRARTGRTARGPAVRGQLPLHADRFGAGTRPGQGDRAVPHLHRRPRLQRLHLHRPGHRVHRSGRGGLPGRRDRARSPGRCTAAPRAGPWTPSTPSAPRTASTPGSANGSSRANASWASATPSTAPRTRAHACCGASRRASAARWWSSRSRWRPGRSDPGGAEAGPGAAHERGVLRGRGHGAVRAAPGDVHADVLRGAGGGLEREHPGTGGGLQDHPPGGEVCRAAAGAAAGVLKGRARPGVVGRVHYARPP